MSVNRSAGMPKKLGPSIGKKKPMIKLKTKDIANAIKNALFDLSLKTKNTRHAPGGKFECFREIKFIIDQISHEELTD